MMAMQHSIAAKFAARPVARFVRPSARARERRLGLPTGSAFHTATERSPTAAQADVGPLVRLRARWRAIRPAPVRRPSGGPIRRPGAISWSRSARSGAATRRPGVATAPWRG
jgi:hypothetical protein